KNVWRNCLGETHHRQAGIAGLGGMWGFDVLGTGRGHRTANTTRRKLCIQLAKVASDHGANDVEAAGPFGGLSSALPRGSEKRISFCGGQAPLPLVMPSLGKRSRPPALL